MGDLATREAIENFQELQQKAKSRLPIKTTLT